MELTRNHKIKLAVVGVALATALVLLFLQTRPPKLPGQGRPAVIVCEKCKTRTPTTWDAVYALPAEKRYLDMSPGGKMTVKCNTCSDWAVVENPPTAAAN